jgi:hypothetical protein
MPHHHPTHPTHRMPTRSVLLARDSIGPVARARLWPAWLMRTCQGVLYALVLVVVFAAIGYLGESTEIAHQAAQERLAALRHQAWQEGHAEGQASMVLALDAAWQAADEARAQLAAQGAADSAGCWLAGR